MIATRVMTMVDGVRIVVPDSLDLITPYVLLEQQDWFEDEIRFLRGLLRPAQQAIDIGANYGVYTLSMAKAVGPEGKVWAFEPASATAELLAQGIAQNAFGQVVLERAAVSSTCGTAQLALNAHSELNTLLREFEGLGYASYRLVPALNLLVPFEPAKPIDGYLLNLFCCKADRARRLEDRGVLLTGVSPSLNLADEVATGRATGRFDGASLAKLPYARQLAPAWLLAKRTHPESLSQALWLHASSADRTHTPKERFAALSASFRHLEKLTETQPTCGRLASLARASSRVRS